MNDLGCVIFEHYCLPLRSEISVLESVIVSVPLKTRGSENSLCGCWRGGGGKMYNAGRCYHSNVGIFVVVFLSYRISFE